MLVCQFVVDMFIVDDYILYCNFDCVWNVWQLSGCCLIVGMSYVGEWEECCVEFFEVVCKLQVVFWIDDFYVWGCIG